MNNNNDASQVKADGKALSEPVQDRMIHAPAAARDRRPATTREVLGKPYQWRRISAPGGRALP